MFLKRNPTKGIGKTDAWLSVRDSLSHTMSKDKKSHSFYIKSKESEFITQGGIHSARNNIPTFSIITFGASPLLAEIHNERKRMPLLHDGADSWLMPDLFKEEMSSMIVPYSHDERLESYRVMDGVTNTRAVTNVEKVLRPFEGF